MHLWKQALQTLELDYEDDGIDLLETTRLKILDNVPTATRQKEQPCVQKRWRYQRRNGEHVILRDVFAKVAARILKFKALGDVVKYDPTGYAAMPWKIISNLLQISVNDTQSLGAMIEAIALVANLITRYEFIERLYLKRDTELESHLSDNLVKMYAIVLGYLVKAKRFFAKNSTRRCISGVANPAQRDVEVFLLEVKAAQADVDLWIGLIDTKSVHTVLIIGIWLEIPTICS